VTDRGGPPEIVEDGVTGRVLPPLDSLLWASAVCDLLDDQDLREAMGQRAEQAARRFTDAAYADGCLRTYRQIQS